MKTTHYLYIMATALLTFSACNNDDVLTDEPVTPTEQPADDSDGFNGTIGDELDILAEEDLDGQPSETRATMSDGAFASWATNDKISICDGTLMYTYQPKEGAIYGANCSFVSKTNASFAQDKEGTFYAFYPADAVLGWNGTTVSTMIYTEQKYEENVDDSGVMGPYMAAVAQTTNGGSSAHFQFGHVCSVIDVDFSSVGETVDAVAIYANSKVSIAGKLTYDASTKVATVNSVNITENTDDPNAYCNGNQSELIRVSEIPSTATFARFYLLPVAQANGFTITVHTTDGNYYTKSSTNAVGTNAVYDTYLASVAGVTGGTACKPYYKKYNFGTTEKAKKNRWMAMIPGSTYFSMLSTPGSHNSATSSGNAGNSSYAKCQSETIAQQLENGVRAFDLRPGYKYSSSITVDNLYIYHSTYSTGVLYKDAIRIITEFLAANPTEAVSIIMMKEDSGGTDYTDAMVTAINSIHGTYNTYFKVLDHSYYTLNDYRGKIFYGCRPNQNITGAVKVTNWPDNNSVTNYGVGVGGLCSASVEDAYNSKDDNKKSVVNALLNLASGNTDKSHFHYTFTSVAYQLLSANITGQAETQNPAAATHIGTLAGPTGYVYGDFMGSSSYSGQTLLKAVIEQNAKYVYKNRTRCAAASASGTDTGVDISSDEYADDTTVFSREQ